jgi:hypothetical protein
MGDERSRGFEAGLEPKEQNATDAPCSEVIRTSRIEAMTNAEWDRIVRAAAGVRYRWHDLRHTFISHLAENPNVSEATLKSVEDTSTRRCWNGIAISASMPCKPPSPPWIKPLPARHAAKRPK